MKRIRKKETTNIFLKVLFFMVITALSITAIVGCSAILEEESISELSFTPDGKKVVFDRCRNEGCQIQVYDLETGELAAYQSPKGERWTMGKYSYDGKRIAFSVIPIKPEGGMELGEMQIAVMDADGKNFRKVTTGQGAKLYPAFSHSGKKILYARAAYIREKGKTPASDYDAWEVDLETGQQTQLTFCKYYYMGYLTYYPDDEKFIYYGELPGEFEGIPSYENESAFKKKMIELGQKGLGIHGIVVMKGKELIPSPYDFPPKVFPQKPLLSADGSTLIYEKSHSGKFHLYSADGKTRYVGGGGSIDAAAISPDGALLAMISVGKTVSFYMVNGGKPIIDELYLPSALKSIENYEKAIRTKESLHGEKYIMLKEKTSKIINR